MNGKRKTIILISAAVLLLLALCALLLTQCRREPLSDHDTETMAGTLTPAEGTAPGTMTDIGETYPASGGTGTAPKTETASAETTPEETTPEEPDTPPETVGADGHIHNYEARGSVAATCTTSGSVDYVCSVCGSGYTKKIAAKGHDFGGAETVVAATCETDGVSAHTCKTCGFSELQAVFATGHKWDKGTVTKETKSCAEDGEMTYTCTVCKKTRTEVYNNRHKWGDWQYEAYEIVVKSASPLDDDQVYIGHNRYHTCAACGKTEYDASIKEHVCGDDISETIQTATCVNGYLEICRFTCKTCGYAHDVSWNQNHVGGNYTHVAMTSREEHLCDASYECDALDVVLYHCTACGETDYVYTFTRNEADSLRGKKMYINISFYSGRSYEQYNNPGSPEGNDAFYKHPTWQNVVRDIRYDDKGYVIQFTYVWHTADGKMLSEVVQCRSEEDMYKYFQEGFADLIDRTRGGTWMLEPSYTQLVGASFLYPY